MIHVWIKFKTRTIIYLTAVYSLDVWGSNFAFLPLKTRIDYRLNACFSICVLWFTGNQSTAQIQPNEDKRYVKGVCGDTWLTSHEILFLCVSRFSTPAAVPAPLHPASTPGVGRYVAGGAAWRRLGLRHGGGVCHHCLWHFTRALECGPEGAVAAGAAGTGRVEAGPLLSDPWASDMLLLEWHQRRKKKCIWLRVSGGSGIVSIQVRPREGNHWDALEPNQKPHINMGRAG